MPSFDIETEEINAFEITIRYMFATYLNDEPLHTKPNQYSFSDRTAFEIPGDELDQFRQILDKFFYDLIIEDNWEEYCVANDREADSRTILRNSVIKTLRGHHEISLMIDKLSIELALEHGATEIEKPGITTEDLKWKTDGS